MATFRKGILGAFYGKVGTVIGSTRRGKDVMRSLPRKSKKQASLLQKMQRDRFTLVANFLLPIGFIAGKYFDNRSQLKTRRNQCMSYLITKATEHDGTQASWDFVQLKKSIPKSTPSLFNQNTDLENWRNFKKKAS